MMKLLDQKQIVVVDGDVILSDEPENKFCEVRICRHVKRPIWNGD